MLDLNPIKYNLILNVIFVFNKLNWILKFFFIVFHFKIHEIILKIVVVI